MFTNLIDVPTWRANYLHGIPDEDATGTPFPEDGYALHLNNGIAALEAALDIAIQPVTITDERHDYYLEDYQDWGYLRLFKKPVQSVASVMGKFPVYNTALTIPTDWITVDQTTGIVNLIPSSGSIAQFIMTGGGSLMPNLFRYQSHVPRFWSVNYTAGFAEDRVPYDINDAIAKMACMSVMNVLGDLIGGVGVLGSSIGLDSVSQFVSTTKTATTAAFYARVLQYRTELFGNGSAGPGSQLHVLKRKYRGIRLTAL